MTKQKDFTRNELIEILCSGHYDLGSRLFAAHELRRRGTTKFGIALIHKEYAAKNKIS